MRKKAAAGAVRRAAALKAESPVENIFVEDPSFVGSVVSERKGSQILRVKSVERSDLTLMSERKEC